MSYTIPDKIELVALGEIPEDVKKAAIIALHDDWYAPHLPIARAIMTERERCARVAEQSHAELDLPYGEHMLGKIDGFWRGAKSGRAAAVNAIRKSGA